MKLKIAALAIAATLIAPSIGLAQFLVDTQEDNWSVSRNNTLTATVLSGVQSSGENGQLSVAKYNGAQTLNRVVIKILQPDTSVSPTLSASISISSGSTTFSSNSYENIIDERTFFDKTGNSVNASIVSAGGSMTNFDSTLSSADYASVTLTNPSTISRSINLTAGPDTIFDSSNYSGIDTTELNSIFKGSGSMTFNFSTTSSFNFARDNTTSISAQLTGINSGKMVIEYYSAIPEPTTLGLVAAGGAVLLFGSRRRRNS